jgi:hypothetical protein
MRDFAPPISDVVYDSNIAELTRQTNREAVADLPVAGRLQWTISDQAPKNPSRFSDRKGNIILRTVVQITPLCPSLASFKF